MRWGWSISLFGHVLILALGFLVWRPSVKPLVTPDVIPVELVVIADKDVSSQKPAPKKPVTKTRPVPPAPDMETRLKPPPKPVEPKQKPEAKIPTKPETLPELSVKSVPEKQPEESKPAEFPKPEKPSPPKEKKKVDIKPETSSPSQKKDEGSFLATLDDLENLVAAEEKKTEKGESKNQKEDSASSASLTSTLRARMNRCWRRPVAAAEPEKLVVEVIVRLRRDGSLDGEPVVANQAAIQASGEAHWASAMDEALRAVKKCAPYKDLPLKHYALWSRLDIRFAADAP